VATPCRSWPRSHPGIPSTRICTAGLAAQLVIDHPALAAPPPTGRTEATQAEALLAARLVLLVLDGLDEIPEQVRGPAIRQINDALRPGERVVVTCRTKQYKYAVRPPGCVEVTLRAAAAVQLRPLDADAVRNYLWDDAAGPIPKARWNPVIQVPGTEAPVGQALRTPLMVGLARADYNPRPGEVAGTLRDPAELCSPRLAGRTAVESLLLDAFIPATYRHEPLHSWTAQDAERWLVFLAGHLGQTIRGPDFAWWQLNRAVPPNVFWHSSGAAAALLAVLLGVLEGRFAAGVQAAIACLAIVEVAILVITRLEIKSAVQYRIGLGYYFDAEVASGDPAGAMSPKAALARDRRVVLLIMLAEVLGILLAGCLGAAIAAGNRTRMSMGLAIGLGSGLGLAILFGWRMIAQRTDWVSYVFARGWLALQHRLPGSSWDFSPMRIGGAFFGKKARSTSSGTLTYSTGSPTGTRINGKRIHQLYQPPGRMVSGIPGGDQPAVLEHRSLAKVNAGHGPVTGICQVRTYCALHVHSLHSQKRESAAFCAARGRAS
jgi:hypothetical protein